MNVSCWMFWYTSLNVNYGSPLMTCECHSGPAMDTGTTSTNCSGSVLTPGTTLTGSITVTNSAVHLWMLCLSVHPSTQVMSSSCKVVSYDVLIPHAGRHVTIARCFVFTRRTYVAKHWRSKLMNSNILNFIINICWFNVCLTVWAVTYLPLIGLPLNFPKLRRCVSNNPPVLSSKVKVTLCGQRIALQYPE